MEGIPLALDAERSPMIELLVIGNLECIEKPRARKQNISFLSAKDGYIFSWVHLNENRLSEVKNRSYYFITIELIEYLSSYFWELALIFNTKYFRERKNYIMITKVSKNKKNYFFYLFLIVSDCTVFALKPPFFSVPKPPSTFLLFCTH